MLLTALDRPAWGYLLESLPDATVPVFGVVSVATPADVLAKANGDLKPNERWITLKPHNGEGKGVHVKIRVGSDGSAHVVHGPGELRGLRLTRLASEEELKERRKAREAEKKEKAKVQEQADLVRSASDPAHAQKLAQDKLKAQQDAAERDKALSALEAKRTEALKRVLEHSGQLTGDGGFTGAAAAALTGDEKAQTEYKDDVKRQAVRQTVPDIQQFDPDEEEAIKAILTTTRGAASVIASENTRAVMTATRKLRDDVVRSLVKDADLRVAVLGEDESVPLPDQAVKPSGAPGYRRTTGQQAARQGYHQGDAQAEAEEVRRKRLDDLRAEDPERADMIADMTERTRARAERAGQLRGDLRAPKPRASVPTQELQEKAGKVREFLKAHNELQEIERQMRAVRLGKDPQASDEERNALAKFDKPPRGAELNVDLSQPDAAFAARLEREIKDAAQADLTRAFLDSVNEDGKAGGYADDLIRRAMHAHIGVGAFSHLANAALSSVGHEGLDRQVVDTLGVEGAAGLLAHAIRRDAPDAELGHIREALAAYHDDQSVVRMREAMDLASAARSDAAQIELPPITSTTDAALVSQLNRERKERIAEAQEALGVALGQVEAGAALNLALKGGARDSLTVRFGDAPTQQVAMQLRALGLTDGEYELKRDADTNQLTATLTRAGMDRLTNPPDDQSRKDADVVRRIKNGDEDESDYLPSGFTARRSSDMHENPRVPPSFAVPPRWDSGVQGAVESVAASRYADGWQPSEIFAHLMDSVARDVPEGTEKEFAAHVAEKFPYFTTTEKTARDGTKYTAYEAVNLDEHPGVQAWLEGSSERWLAEHHPGQASFHNQRLLDTPQTHEALFKALAAEPALLAAFKAPGEIGGDQVGRQAARAIQGYFFKHLLPDLGGKDRKEHDSAQAAKRDKALAELGEAPEKWGGQDTGLFGGVGGDGREVTLGLNPHATGDEHARALEGYGLSGPEHYTLTDKGAQLTEAGRAALRVPEKPLQTEDEKDIVTGGLDAINPAWVEHNRKASQIRRKYATSTDRWNDFVETMRGNRNAYAAVQERMQHDLISRFVQHHASLTGEEPRVSKLTTQHWERRLAALDPAKRDEIRARDQQLQDTLRERTSSGQYRSMGAGGLVQAVQQHVEKMSRQRLLQGSLGFDLTGAQGGGEVLARGVHHLNPGDHERVTLGRAAESRLAQMLRTGYGVKADGTPVSLIQDVTWGAGSKHVGKQRVTKMLLKTGRVGGFLGAGSGKTSTMIGAFTQAHADGKARQAHLVVPSIVRDQFGEEAARFTNPGQYRWHAHDDTFEGRKAALKDPEMHMVVRTHQTFRDDTLKLMAEHQGVTPEEMTARFTRMARPARAEAYRAAMQHHGIPTEFLSIDEAHDFLNRAGKKDSVLSMVGEAALDNAKFKSVWTGSPTKNDVSEAHDWLSKLDPTRFSDRDAFMRKYGGNTRACREAFQRLMDSYTYIDAVRPDVQRTVTWGRKDDQGRDAPLPLSPQQRQAYQQVEQAYQQASAARRRGTVDMQAARTLSPNSFEGAPEEQHEQIAHGIHRALGTIKQSALARVVNEFPAAHNAKVQHVLTEAKVSKQAGHGMVVFAHHRRSVEMLKQELERQGHKVGVIDGSTSTSGKGDVRRAFDQGKVDIVVCSDAGATGANLQKRGRKLINYDIPMTQKTLEQRNARIDRLGQEGQIDLQHLMTDTAFDRDNVRRVHRKRELGEILQGEFRGMDDIGLASYIRRARAEQQGDGPEGWEEPLQHVAPMHENARPEAKGAQGGQDWRSAFKDAHVQWGTEEEAPQEDAPPPLDPNAFHSLF